MQDRSPVVVSLSDVVAEYDAHLLKVRGLSKATRKLHRYVVHRLLSSSFPTGSLSWHELAFSGIAEFIANEFRRLQSCATQRVWLMALRSFLRYLAAEGHVPVGWDAALPGIANRQHAQLPRGLTQQQISALWTASDGTKPRDLRNRALFLLFLRLGLRTEEVAALVPSDIDWRNGTLKVRSSKTQRVRTLPLAQDVGEALAVYLRSLPVRPLRLFDPTRKPPVPEQRYEVYVRNCIYYLLQCAGIRDRGPHGLRHTLATEMVGKGATFKAVSDVLGHKSITTTLIYAKLDLESLKQVALPWPGGAR